MAKKAILILVLAGIVTFFSVGVVAAEKGGEEVWPKIDIPQGEQHACVDRHVVVYDEPGRYAGWPANGGFWLWGDKMAVSFECGWFKDKPDWEDGHARDMSRGNADIVAHSNDGGLTWTHGDYPAMSSSDGMVPLDKEMDFSAEGFAFKCQGERFYYTYDYGVTWSGPFKLNILGRPFDDDHIESHTTYLPTGAKEGYFFFGVEPDGAEDRFYCTKTTDGGKSFNFLGWVSPSIKDAPKYERWAIYSAVEVKKGHLVAALRRKIDKRGKIKRLNWIDVYESKDSGKTWKFLSKVADTDVVNSDFNGNPPSLLKLKDGRLAVTFGFRGRPTSMCAKLSSDNGKTWGDVVILRRGSRNWDFGYSRSLERDDGKIITVYYWATPKHRNQYLTATIWDPSKVKGDGVSLSGLPEAVQTTIKEVAKGGKIVDVEEGEDDGEVIYEVSIDRNGKIFDAEVDSWGELKREDVSLESVSEDVRKTIVKLAKGGKVSKIQWEYDKDGSIYEVEIEKKGRELEFEVDLSGELVKEEILEDSVPAAVLKTIKANAEGGKITKFEQKHDGGEVEYKGHVEVDGGEIEIKVSASGELIEVE